MRFSNNKMSICAATAALGAAESAGASIDAACVGFNRRAIVSRVVSGDEPYRPWPVVGQKWRKADNQLGCREYSRERRRNRRRVRETADCGRSQRARPSQAKIFRRPQKNRNFFVFRDARGTTLAKWRRGQSVLASSGGSFNCSPREVLLCGHPTQASVFRNPRGAVRTYRRNPNGNARGTLWSRLSIAICSPRDIWK